jgi:hypothetical protein
VILPGGQLGPLNFTVPHSVPTLHRKPLQMVVERWERESPLLVQQFNTIANDGTPSQLSLDGLLISGLQVRVLPGSPLLFNELCTPEFGREKADVVGIVVGEISSGQAEQTNLPWP